MRAVWDPDQRAEIPVLIDRLLAQGDPLGEWFALHLHLDAGEVARERRKGLRRRLRALREELRGSLALAEDPRFGRPHVIRELGLIADVSLRRGDGRAPRRAARSCRRVLRAAPAPAR